MSRESHNFVDAAAVIFLVVVGLLYIADAFPHSAARALEPPAAAPAVLAVDGGMPARTQPD